MPLFVAVALYGGAFIGYVVGNFGQKDEPPQPPAIISIQTMLQDAEQGSAYRLIGAEDK